MTPRAAALALAAALLFTLETALVKAIAAAPLALVVLARAVGQLAWTAPALRRQGLGLLRTRHPRMAVFRGVLSVSSWWVYYLSFGALPLALATVLNFTAALFTAALAEPLLGERVGWRRWAATLAGFAGVLVVLRPGMVPLGWPVAAGLAAALCGAGTVLVTRWLARVEGTQTIMAWIGVVALAAALPPAIPVLAWPGARDAALLGAVAVLGPAAMHCWIAALRMAEASAVTPLLYTRLLFAAALGWALFGEAPDAGLLPGAALIVGAALYVTRAEAARRGRAAGATGERGPR